MEEGTLDSQAARDLDALRIDPAIVLREQGSDHGTDVFGDAYASQGRHLRDVLVHFRIVSNDAAAEIGCNGAWSDNVDGNPAWSELLCHIFRQHFNRPLHRTMRRASNTDDAHSACRCVR